MKILLSFIFSLLSLSLLASGNANVTISTSATSNGSWSALTGGTYTFTPNANTANILNSEIQNRITGTGFTAGNVTIVTACSGTGTQSGNVTVSSTITAAGAARTFTITAAGTITVSSAINLTASAGNAGGRISFAGTTGVTVNAALTTNGSSPGTPGSNANGGAGGSISLTSSSGAVSVTSTLTARGAAGGTGGSASGGAGGAITISGTSVSISSTGTISTIGANGPGFNGGAGGAVSITSTSSLISVSASITTSGGNAGSANTGGRGGNAGAVTFTAYTTLSTAAITANGGTNGGYFYNCGGSGATVTLRGTSVSNGTISWSAGTNGGGATGCGNSGGSTVNCTRGNVGSQSSNAHVTKNIAITAITHSTALITGVGTPSGLPPGLSASYSSNTITISGTPTTGGTYTYSWAPTTSSSCGATNVAGTIIVDETLPVEFVDFAAELKDSYVELFWQTASEVNNEKFIVEKSLDGENWFTIAEIKGAGNSNSILSYQYIDNNVNEGVQYYRLTQVDFDGKQEKSKIEEIFKKIEKTFEFEVYPNPIKDDVQVSFIVGKIERYRFSIWSQIGQELHSSVMMVKEGENVFTYNTATLAEGVYFFKIEREDGVIVYEKVVK